MIKYIWKKGFTLAEVLIALVVIGVIAAITVPILFEDYQKKETVSRLLKAYSTLARTTSLAISDNGSLSSWAVEGLSAEEFSKQYLKPYLYTMAQKSSNEFNYRTLNGQNDSANYGSIFYLADGSKVSVQTPDVSEWGIQVWVYVDINGDKNPNKMGRDVFKFDYWVYHASDKNVTGKFIPWGLDWPREQIINGNNTYHCSKNHTGELCAALIAKDGWQIKEDYPW